MNTLVNVFLVSQDNERELIGVCSIPPSGKAELVIGRSDIGGLMIDQLTFVPSPEWSKVYNALERSLHDYVNTCLRAIAAAKDLDKDLYNLKRLMDEITDRHSGHSDRA